MLPVLLGSAGLVAAALFSSRPRETYGAVKAGTTAEQHRLMQELTKLARRNAWTGVERTYRKLLEIGLPSSPDAHYLGAKAAGQTGDVLEVRRRLLQAIQAGQGQTVLPGSTVALAQDDLEQISGRFGEVAIRAKKKHVLAPVQMPFAPDERMAIEHARAQLQQKGSFRGLLPMGAYTLGKGAFEVVARQQARVGYGASYGNGGGILAGMREPPKSVAVQQSLQSFVQSMDYQKLGKLLWKLSRAKLWKGKNLWQVFWRIIIKRFALRGTVAAVLAASDGPLPIGDLLSIGLTLYTIAEIVYYWNEIWMEVDQTVGHTAVS